MYLSVFFGLFALASASVSYEGYQVLRLQNDHENVGPIQKMVDSFRLDIWGDGKGWMDIMVSPDQSGNVKKQLHEIGASYKILINDVGKLVERDYWNQQARQGVKADLDFSVYNTFEDIEAYLADLPAQDDRTSLKSLGQSVEGRDLWQLTISVGEGKQPVWFDCGIHAREWISPATCLWGINFLLTGYGSDPNATALLDAYDVLINPVNNPDGYVFTQTDRMWRKNRNVYPENLCVGVDLNRNFDDNFGGEGTSGNSCSNTYRGPYASSEPETQATQAGINEIASSAKVLFTIHSYSQFWLYPYGYTSELPAEADELDAVSKAGVDALTAVHGTSYTYGSFANVLYLGSSNTIDYAYAQGIVYSFLIELRDTGEYGFLLPEDQIVATAEETWQGIIAATLAIP